MNCRQYYPEPYVVLPSIQSMLDGAQVNPQYQQYHYTPPSYKPPVSIYQLQTLEPSLENMNNAAYHRSRHMRHYSDVTQSRKHQNYHRYEHRRAVSEHAFDHARNKSTNCMMPHFCYDQQDSEDSSSGCSTPPPQQQPCVRLQGLALDKYDCPHCDKRFSRPSSLRTHIYSHTGEKPYTCNHPDCNRTFSVRSNMRRHMKTHKPFIHRAKK
ncbi:ubiquitin-protein ligase peroxin 12 [Mucor velutinosus]|uniref:Ubiquitin-protein ligase peroxin 12 n=1 Tax=Mucor velutinosus TaxID=708070 RepID=A0AAN7I3D1_9FUNG|nr:ubiquitin-protein ligase peroxin 12 [Mucor velutinosus]